MKLIPLMVALLFMAGCCTTPQPPDPLPTEKPHESNIIKPMTPAETNAWPRRGWN